MQRSTEFDLGLDKTRMKDPRDAVRQHATVDALLGRLFSPDPDARRELQIVADEVGMGKTFVALGAAYSILAAMKRGEASADLAGCYRKVLIITPPNAGLFAKWSREVGEFVKRCVRDEHKADARAWFAADRVERWDELPAKLRRTGAGAAVLVGQMTLFRGGKVLHYNLKRRLVLGLACRFWGVQFKNDDRERLLKGAPDGWPSDPAELTALTDDERALVPLGEAELWAGIKDLGARGELDRLLETCRAIARPYARDRVDLFRIVADQLMSVYEAATWAAVRQALPLVIVDEAHHWKNGPTTGANGYKTFAETIACRTRRAVLLTATPFQLRPQEMVELLKLSDHLAPAPTEKEAAPRRQRLTEHRQHVLEPVLRNSERASREFSKAWNRIPRSVDTWALAAAWHGPALVLARAKLRALAAASGVVDELQVASIAADAVKHLDPAIREAVRVGLHLFTYNVDLSSELATVVIRHRRHTQHRAFLVGTEYEDGVASVAHRQDRNVLHGASGMDVRGDAELPHYLLMRCVSEMKQGQGRSSLGTALTGCYSTLLHSAEGKKIQTRLPAGSLGAVYLEALRSSVGEAQDPEHPKVRRVVDSVLEAWKRGEKSLVFCFRVNTAKRLQKIIDDRLRAELDSRQQRCLGGEQALKNFKGRMTRRDGNLVGLGLDRVLWSLYWATPRMVDRPFDGDALMLIDGDLAVIAEAAIRYGVDILADGPDRVFLHRAIEHALAVRLVRDGHAQGDWKRALDAIADQRWISHPYGESGESEVDDAGAEGPAFDERGVHSVYPEVVSRPPPIRVRELAEQLSERRSRLHAQGRAAIVDAYERAPSLWFGPDPGGLDAHPHRSMTIRRLHTHLRELTFRDGRLDWNSRRLAFEALRRALLRDSVLLRLLPERSDRDEAAWDALLAERFYEPLPAQTESMADRIAVFAEDLAAASGQIGTEGDARDDLYQATKLRDQQFVALASGGDGPTTRTRVFAGFNTPLLPEILICTSVGQEGIDLHRHCRHVIHYDLAWNPAVLEQRTGRADRIGSMTFRERTAVGAQDGPFLEVGVPFLAGTYDERMYEELRLRAQTFEILTGGDLSADNPDGNDDEPSAEGVAAGLRMVALPDEMIADLRVRLHVWQDERPFDVRGDRAPVV